MAKGIFTTLDRSAEPTSPEEHPMSYADTILPEFDHEMANTRKVLERVPDDKLDWQPHPKSHTIGWNANHLANIPDWLVDALANAGAGYRPCRRRALPLSQGDHGREILETFDRNVAAARDAITRVKDEQMGQMWTLSNAGKPIFTMPRAAVSGASSSTT